MLTVVIKRPALVGLHRDKKSIIEVLVFNSTSGLRHIHLQQR